MTTPTIAKFDNGDSGLIHFIDSNRGVYIPQAFMEMIDPQYWQPITDDDKKILLAGPYANDNSAYWDVWHEFTCGGQYVTDQDGNKWYLHQDDDLFLMCIDKMTDEEKENFDIM